MRLSEEMTHGESIPLNQLGRGQRGRVECCMLDDCCLAMMESLGLDRDSVISVCRHGDPCIVRVHHRCGGSCRIGLRRELSRSIMVRPTTG
jgi:Fe2+ transport system protein FeoA